MVEVETACESKCLPLGYLTSVEESGVRGDVLTCRATDLSDGIYNPSCGSFYHRALTV